MNILDTMQPSTKLNASLRSLCAGLFALLLMAAMQPAQAQMDDGELPKIDFSVNLMQSAQYLSVDRDGTEPVAGFHASRVGLVSSVQFSENVSGLLMLESEPNDFGGLEGAQFYPQVDFAIMDLQLTDQLTFRTGTPVTGLLNFRGFSDGPAVQGNPLIGNSPADMITAGQGVKLIGTFDSFGFDFTINRGFGEDLTNLTNNNDTGLNLIGKFRYTGSDMFKVGAGLATHTGDGVPPNNDGSGNPGLVFANGDRENYNLSGEGASATASTATNTTATHANMPAGTIFHADAKVMVAGADIDAWGGYATESDTPIYGSDNDFQAIFGGLGVKYNLSDDFYAAGRFTYVGDQSDAVSDFDNTSMSRIQLGIGYMVYDKALLKVEYVSQSETGLNASNQEGTALSRIGDSWSGLTTELSFNF